MYASHTRLCRHFGHSAGCRNALSQAGFQCTPLPGEGSRKADLGHECLTVATVAAGPQRVWETSAPHSTAQPVAPLVDLFHGLFEDGLIPDSDSALLEDYRHLLSQFSCSQSMLRDSLLAWEQSLLGPFGDALPITALVGHRRATGQALQCLRPEWLLETLGQPGGTSQHAFVQGEEQLRALRISHVVRGLPALVADPAFLLAPRNMWAALCKYRVSQHTLCAPSLAEGACAWADQLQEFGRQNPGGFVFVHLCGFRFRSVELPAPPKQLRALHTSKQHLLDSLLIAAQLWGRGVPFAFHLPVSTRAIAPTLQGIWETSRAKGWLLSNVAPTELESTFPFCFTLLI